MLVVSVSVWRKGWCSGTGGQWGMLAVVAAGVEQKSARESQKRWTAAVAATGREGG